MAQLLSPSKVLLQKWSWALIAFLGVLAVLLLIFMLRPKHNQSQSLSINSFEECTAAGYPIMESYPEQCRTPDGRNFVREIEQPAGESIEVTGRTNCLPKRNTGGPVTMECAIGLETETGFYALDLSQIDEETRQVVNLIGEGSIRVTGIFVPTEELEGMRWNTYEMLGMIQVTSAENL